MRFGICCLIRRYQRRRAANSAGTPDLPAGPSRSSTLRAIVLNVDRRGTMSLSFIDVSNRALYLKILTDFASRSVRDFGRMSATISKLSIVRPELFLQR